jgi:hypothetical protein
LNYDKEKASLSASPYSFRPSINDIKQQTEREIFLSTTMASPSSCTVE